MSDPLHEMLRELRNAPAPAAFASPAAVRRRGRQRSQRAAVAAGTAVLAVGAAVGVTMVPSGTGRPGPVSSGPVASRSAAPSPLTSPDAAAVVLRPADLGPGDWEETGAELFYGPLWFWAYLCGGDLGTSTLERQLWLDTISYRDGPRPSPFGDTKPVYSVIVERYEPGWAARNLTDVRAAVNRCTPDEFAVVGGGFAGDESVLVRQHGDRYVAVVRVGDLIATVLPPPGRGEQFTIGLARVAADRLS